MATETSVPTTHRRLLHWVDEAVALCEPDDVHWCDGSAEEYDALCRQLVDAGTFERLSDAKRPNSYLARSDPGDVARVEDRTFICSEREQDAGPTNNWREPKGMRASLYPFLRGSVRAARPSSLPFSLRSPATPPPHIAANFTAPPSVAVS